MDNSKVDLGAVRAGFDSCLQLVQARANVALSPPHLHEVSHLFRLPEGTLLENGFSYVREC